MKNKQPYSGYLLAFEPRRTQKIAEKLSDVKEASESFSAMDWTFERREIVFLVLDSDEISIGGAVLMERMHGSGGTGKLKMRLSKPVLFERPIDIEEIRDVIDLEEYVSTAEELNRIDPAIWSDLIEIIKKIRPESNQELSALLAMREEERQLLGDSAKIMRLAEQRDAIGLALDITNLDRQSVMRSLNTDGIDDAKSILDLLDNESVEEQDIIRHDEEIFKNLFDEEMRHAKFTGRSGRTVRIHVYDKKPLETVIGIDLLIYQEAYQSFLLIQYKNMKQIESKGSMTWSYLVNKHMEKQIEAMNQAEIQIQKQATITGGIWDWRLDTSPFFFKFCETTRKNVREDSLMRGITLGVAYVKKFLALPESEGGNGGRRIGYNNCPRYFNNSQFVELAREGWIGCDRKGFAFISELLAENQRGGKQAMLAVIEGTVPKDSFHRGRQMK